MAIFHFTGLLVVAIHIDRNFVTGTDIVKDEAVMA